MCTFCTIHVQFLLQTLIETEGTLMHSLGVDDNLNSRYGRVQTGSRVSFQ